MTQLVQLALADLSKLSIDILSHAGFNQAHAQAISNLLYTCQLDDCQSHGLFRLMLCTQSMRLEQADGNAVPAINPTDNAIVHVDAHNGMSPLAFELGLPKLIEKTRKHGIAALAINHCFHFSALWPEVEQLADARLAAMAMLPSRAWVAPAGGRRGSLGTNPLAFSWPRINSNPFTFDFATSALARGEIELHKRANTSLPQGVAIDKHGNQTTDPQSALDGFMLTFGGYKGSALSIMIELLAGPLIDDLISLESMEYSKTGAPYHGEIVIAFDPVQFSRSNAQQNQDRAERLFADIVDQGARLPSQRRFAARKCNLERGYVEISQSLHKDLLALLQ